MLASQDTNSASAPADDLCLVSGASLQADPRDFITPAGSGNPSAYAPLPFLPFPVRAHADYALRNAPVVHGKVVETSRIEAIASIPDAKTGTPLPLAVAPQFSILLDPATQVTLTGGREPMEVNVLVRNNLVRSDLIAGEQNPSAASGSLRVDVPDGWRVEPSQIPVPVTDIPQERTFKFSVQPGNLREGRYQISASLSYLGKKYVEGYSTVSREDLGGFYYYQPAIQRVTAVTVKLPQKNLNIGYIMGAGDDIPAVLKQIGMSVSLYRPKIWPVETCRALTPSCWGFGLMTRARMSATTISACCGMSSTAAPWSCNITPALPSLTPAITRLSGPRSVVIA